MVIYLERDADLHMAQLMPLPLTVSCCSKIQIGFTFLAPAHPGSPGQTAVKRVCVRVCVLTVLTVDKNDCRSSRPLNARLPSGRIASVTAHESRCTSRYDATWIIRAEPGQRVNISLLDFNAAAHLGRRIPAVSSSASKPDVTVRTASAWQSCLRVINQSTKGPIYKISYDVS